MSSDDRSQLLAQLPAQMAAEFAPEIYDIPRVRYRRKSERAISSASRCFVNRPAAAANEHFGLFPISNSDFSAGRPFGGRISSVIADGLPTPEVRCVSSSVSELVKRSPPANIEMAPEYLNRPSSSASRTFD